MTVDVEAIRAFIEQGERDRALVAPDIPFSRAEYAARLDRLRAAMSEDGIDSLVLPTAYSFNHDGTCLYFAAVSVFLAQARMSRVPWNFGGGPMIIRRLRRSHYDGWYRQVRWPDSACRAAIVGVGGR